MTFKFIDRRFSFRQAVTANFHRYKDSNNVAIELVCDDEESSGQHWCMASVNVPGEILDDILVAIKTHSENEGLDGVLIEAGVIEPIPVRYLDSGFVQIPIYRLTPAAIAMVNQTKGLSK